MLNLGICSSRDATVHNAGKDLFPMKNGTSMSPVELTATPNKISIILTIRLFTWYQLKPGTKSYKRGGIIFLHIHRYWPISLFLDYYKYSIIFSTVMDCLKASSSYLISFYSCCSRSPRTFQYTFKDHVHTIYHWKFEKHPLSYVHFIHNKLLRLLQNN